MELKIILRDKKGRFIKGSHPKTEFKNGSIGYWIGKHLLEGTKQKMSESHEGQIPWMKGKFHSKEAKEKMKKTQFKIGHTPWSKGLKGIHSGEDHPNWQGGISFEPYTFDFNKELKELIRRRDNYKCRLCGMPECENIRKLCIHHIDYDKKNCSPNNLISLCVRCNPKVNFNRDYWKEYFRNKME